MNVASLAALSPEELVTRVRSLNAEGNRLLANLLIHLGEVDKRRLYREHACSSMFAFCRRLGMSEGSAARRIDAARAIRKFPSLLRRIESGQLHLTALSIVCSILTPENVESVVASVIGKSRLEVEELKVRYAPKADVKDLIRKMPESKTAEPTMSETETKMPESPAPFALWAAVGRSETLAPPPVAVIPVVSNVAEGAISPPPVAVIPAASDSLASKPRAHAPPPVAVTSEPTALEPQMTRDPAPIRAVVPLREDAYKVQLMASKAVVDKIERAKDMMRHRNPKGELATIVDAALDLLIAKLEKERFGKTDRPQKATRPCKPGHVPLETRRQLFERDGYQCTFVDEHGHRCCERGWLEIDHVDAKGRGGDDGLANLRVRCRAHNQMHAKDVFGAEHVERCIRESRLARATKRAVDQPTAATSTATGGGDSETPLSPSGGGSLLAR